MFSTVDGGWSSVSWINGGQCDAPCGGGFKRGTRQCNNPTPKNGGRPCAADHLGGGNGEVKVACNAHSCPSEIIVIHSNPV